MSLTVEQPRPRSLTGIFNRKKSTYGLVQPFEYEQDLAQVRPKKSSSCHEGGMDNSRDCFVPSEMDTWELPQYQSLFHHLITQDEDGRQRLNSVSSNGSNKFCPLKAIQKWFKDLLRSFRRDSNSGEADLEEPNAIEEIPIEMCEKLRHIHIYF